MVKNLLVIVAFAIVMFAVVGCGAAPTASNSTLSAVADPVPPAFTSSNKVTPPPSGSTTSPAPGSGVKSPVPQPAPRPFVVPATPASEYDLGQQVHVVEYPGIPKNVELGVFLPALTTMAIYDPEPDTKVLAILSVAGFETALYVSQNKESIGKALAPVFVGTWEQIKNWSLSLQSPAVLAQANMEMSVGHQESAGVIANIRGLTDSHGMIHSTGDGRSNGSIRIFAGTDEDPQLGYPRLNFAILYVFGSNMKFAVASAKYVEAAQVSMPGLTRVPASRWFFNPKDLVWTCAWILADRQVGSSKKLTPPQNLWFNVGQGWAAWSVISQRYHLVIPVAELPLPPSPF